MMPKITYKELREYFTNNMEQIPNELHPAPHIKFNELRRNIQDDLDLIEHEMNRLQKREQITRFAPIRAAVCRLRDIYHWLSQ